MELLSPEEACKFLKISPSHIKEMARKGILPAVKVGKFWRFPKGQLEQWVQEGMASSNYEKLHRIVDNIIAEVST